MECFRKEGDGHVIRLNLAERELLLALLRMYPVIPPGHLPASRGGLGGEGPEERLLEEALAEQRKGHRDRVEALLADPGRIVKRQGAWEWLLSEAEMEWLLQVLNDVRVGSWVRLGMPDGTGEGIPRMTIEGVRLHKSMELSAFFQQGLIRALAGEP
jgi:hypothetical protein